MVHIDLPRQGTNIIYLFFNHVSDGERVNLPSQDLFENIGVFNERLIYSPCDQRQENHMSS